MKKLGWCIALFCIHYNAYARVSKGINNLNKIPIETQCSHLHNCKSENSSIPRTEFDIVSSALGLGVRHKLAQAKECLKQRLLEVRKQICQEKENIYTQAQLQSYLLFWLTEDIYTQDQEYRNYDQRYKQVQSGIDRIEELQLRWREWLSDQADRYHAKADRYDDSSSMCHDELRAYAEIFESEARIICLYERYRREL